MSEPSDPGVRREVAVRYDEYFHAQVPHYTHVSVEQERSIVESVAAKENSVDGIRCTVVGRTVTYGEWEVLP